tara:strand:+ start:1611 stop:2273 length:663 start_codon:yes stop_codon:yes gene_type:complete
MSGMIPKIEDVLKKQGVFGLGFSTNSYLDLMNLVVLAISGIIIKIFFKENYSKLGDVGPASTTIWGYGLTSMALFLMVFLSIFLARKFEEDRDKNIIEHSTDFSGFFNFLSKDYTTPIVLTLSIVIYIIVLNYIYFSRINSNNVSDSYHTYSTISSFILIIQVCIIIKYMFNILSHSVSKISSNENSNSLLKNLSYLLVSINFIFVVIIHILLAFFSTDG